MKAVIFKKNNLYKFKGGYGKIVELKIKRNQQSVTLIKIVLCKFVV